MGTPRLLLAAAIAAFICRSPAFAEAPNAEHGKYIFAAGGCYACHTDAKNGGAPLAGGPPLKTPFGTFYAPNITPDVAHGIGGWTDAQFERALHEGIGPDGAQLYPVFPYAAYTKATTRDLLDLRAYLKTIPPSDKPSRPHDVAFPFSIRLTLLAWKWLNFSAGEFSPDPKHDAAWNRGAYLVEALLHCAECHTPRNATGGLDRARWMAGARFGERDDVAPNLTPNPAGLGKWSANDIADALNLGIDPDGDVLGNEMAEVVKNSTSQLTQEDRQAVAAYLKALPPLPDAVPPKAH